MRFVYSASNGYKLILRAKWEHQLTFPFKDISSGSWNRERREGATLTDEVAPYHGRMNGTPYWLCHDCRNPILDKAGNPIWDARNIEEFDEDYINEEKRTGPVLDNAMLGLMQNTLNKTIADFPAAIEDCLGKARADDYIFDFTVLQCMRNKMSNLAQLIEGVLSQLYAALFVNNIKIEIPRLPHTYNDRMARELNPAINPNNAKPQLEEKIIQLYKPFFIECQKIINTLKPLEGLAAIEVVKSKVLLPLCETCAEDHRYYCQHEDCDFYTTDDDDIIEVERVIRKEPDAQHNYHWNLKVTETYCEEHAALCEACNKGVLKDDDETIEYEGDYYHQECFNEVYRYCEGCNEYHYAEDMYYDEERGDLVCANCYEEDREEGVESDIEDRDLEEAAEIIDSLPKMFPIDEKMIDGSIIPAIKAGIKKVNANPTMPFDKQIEFVIKRIQKKEAQNAVLVKSRSLDSLHDLYNYFEDHKKQLNNFQEKYPKLKGFKPLPVDIRIENSAWHHAGKVFAIYPSKEFLDYAELTQPGAREVYGEYIKLKGHHPGSLAYARFSMSDGNIIIDNLQTDIDAQTFKSSFHNLEIQNNKKELNALKWWVSAIKKFWVPLLLDAMNKFGKEIERKVYLTSFEMQQKKWHSIPDRNKDVYDRIPEIMQFPTESAEVKPEDLTKKTYQLRRVAKSLDKGAYSYYKLAQLV